MDDLGKINKSLCSHIIVKNNDKGKYKVPEP